MKTRLLSALMIVVVLLTACGVKSAIKGQWQQANGEVLEFADDGVLRVTSMGITITGSYEFTDSDTVQISVPGLLGSSTQSFDASISGDTLTLASNGVSIDYTRVK